MNDFKPISQYRNARDGDVVMLKLKDGNERVGCFYDCEWMRDEGDDVADAFSKYSGDNGNHIEMEEIQGFRAASEKDIRDDEDKFEFPHSEEPTSLQKVQRSTPLPKEPET